MRTWAHYNTNRRSARTPNTANKRQVVNSLSCPYGSGYTLVCKLLRFVLTILVFLFSVNNQQMVIWISPRCVCPPIISCRPYMYTSIIFSHKSNILSILVERYCQKKHSLLVSHRLQRVNSTITELKPCRIVTKTTGRHGYWQFFDSTTTQTLKPETSFTMRIIDHQWRSLPISFFQWNV